MARGTTTASDSESDREIRATKNNTSATKASKSKDSIEAVAQEDQEGPEDQDDQMSEAASEEYEIQKILDAKLGTFPGGRMGYLVKWKGYGEQHNSWVDEKDATNAQALIDEYWQIKKGKDKKVGRKSTTATPRMSASKPRKSWTVRDESSEVEEVRPKKRGRPSKVKPARVASEQADDIEEEEGSRDPKKARRTSNKAEPMEEDEDPDAFRNMKTYMSMATWEYLVDTIDTVERTPDGRLLVYFTLKNGKGRGREETSVCKDKMPKKMLDFYENNLRWRMSEEIE